MSGFEAHCEIYDPWADPAEVEQEYNVRTIKNLDGLTGNYDAIIVAVGHKEFFNLDYNQLRKNNSSVIYDIKGILDKDIINGRL